MRKNMLLIVPDWLLVSMLSASMLLTGCTITQVSPEAMRSALEWCKESDENMAACKEMMRPQWKDPAYQWKDPAYTW